MAAAAFVITGCGDQTATKSDVIARGNAICASEIRDVRSVTAPAALGSLAGLSQYLEQVVPIVRKEVSSLESLPRPARDRAGLERFLTSVGRDGARYRALATAAARGDRSGVQRALTELRLSPSTLLAARYGLVHCASGLGTGVS